MSFGQWMKRHRGWFALGLFIVSAIPALLLIYDFYQQNLGANPVETMTHITGGWGLRFLLLSLLVTPLRRWFSWNWLQNYRRQLGLWALFYVVAHFGIYWVFDQGLDLSYVWEDVLERPYIAAGMLALLLLIPLGVTSLKWWQKRLGKRWFYLHRLAYVAAIAAVVHFWWLVKVDVLEPLIYAAILAVLLLTRLFYYFKKRYDQR